MTSNSVAIRSMTSGESSRLSFVDTIKGSLRRAFVYSGRASRREYWSLALLSLVAPLALFAIAVIGADALYGAGIEAGTAIGELVILAAVVLFIALQVALLSAAVRRLHDAGYSGWVYLIGLIPYVGGFILLWFLVQASQEGKNKYDAHPYRPDGTPSYEESLAQLASLADRQLITDDEYAAQRRNVIARQQTPTGTMEEKLRRLAMIADQGLMNDGEHAQKRAELLAQL